jgi:esterase/lipase/1-acyl-sn-glycerol-3-phosphate acyltransferase
MNKSAYLTTGLVIKALSGLSRARVQLHGVENIPDSPVVFAINHFTRMETLLLPYHIYKVTGKPVWSLADASLFKGPLASFLDSNGAVSTASPDRDRLIVKTLLAGEAHWVIFPEGRMVKNKKVYKNGGKRGRFVVTHAGGTHAPHTGAAALALRTEFYRERIRRIRLDAPVESCRLCEMFAIQAETVLSTRPVSIVPVNLTYYPIRARENILSHMAASFMGDLPKRFLEEIMTEGTMLVSGVDVDIRFGKAIGISRYLKSRAVQADIASETPINFDDPIRSRGMLRKTAYNIMDRCMSDIYRMTTVNHDHLFASVLKYMPHEVIREMDFRRRVYMVASRYPGLKGIYRHTSLNDNQIHLLTDDRYRRFENFLALALEKKALIRRKGRLYKNSKLFSGGDFHTARIENPIAVIANEVEPLGELQSRCREMALQSSVRTRYWLVRNLVERAVFEFDRDYSHHAIEGESKPTEVGMPMLLKGDGRRIGVLLIHGYMAAPMEVAQLARHLNQEGIWVYVPRLPGHGTAPEDLAGVSYVQWIEAVDSGFAILANLCRMVIAGGFSTGAGLALDLAARIDGVAGVFAVAPPLRLQDFSSRFVPAVDLWNRIMSRVNFNAATKAFVENKPENPHINYLRNPVSGIHELEQLMDKVKDRLGNVRVPAVVIQGRADPVVSTKGAVQVFNLLGSDSKELFLLDFHRHGILLGEGAEAVYGHVLSFIGRVAAGVQLQQASGDESDTEEKQPP